jgi:hypothetical protein
MSVAQFERADLPKAGRTIAAAVADVYGAIEAIERWPSWIHGVAAPVQVLGDDAFDVSWVHDGAMTTHRVVVVARGPVHTLFAQVDQRHRIYFRTRPVPAGTHVELVAEQLDEPRWWTRLFRTRRMARTSDRLRSLLDQLATHVEPRPT